MKENLSRRDFLVGVTSATASMLIPYGSIRGSEDEFEYIVVGSGAGGGPVASNLARAGKHVLLLEAGDASENLNYSIPAFNALSTEDPLYSWNYFVKHYEDPELQKKDSKYVPGKGIFYPRAGTLGGCTAHNAMVTMYPDNSDWDTIVELTGDSSWNSHDMRTYFERVERAQYLRPKPGNPQRHGFNGWLSTEQSSIRLLLGDKQLLRIVLSAAKEGGYSGGLSGLGLDPNDWNVAQESKEGTFNTPKSTDHGRRNGTREFILKTIAQFPQHLKLRTNTLVTKVIFEGNRAIGVEYLEGSHLYQADPKSTATSRAFAERKVAKASKEVILAGGAFNTPQLLMLSGIGPKAELERHGISLKVDLPGVGKNLQDHYEIGIVSRLKRPVKLIENCKFGESTPDTCMADYKKNPEMSVYGSNGVVIGLKKRTSPNKKDPDIFIFGIPGDFHGYYPGYAKNILKEKDCFSWVILQGHEKNTEGRVKLNSSDPTDTPDICFHYYDEGTDTAEEDINATMKGVEIVRRINTGARRVIREELIPGPNVTGSEVKDFIKREAWGHHASCSNKMGSPQDEYSVVDSKFRVKGTRGLRIVDASVFPKIPGLFIVLPIYMIAEKASDEILKEPS